MPTIEDRVKVLERQMTSALAAAGAIQGQPTSAIISIPHNDSWLFEDNVDSTHAANLRYVIASNVQRVVSARLTMHLAPYRTYNSLSLTTTGNNSQAESGHSHSHGHSLHISTGASAANLAGLGAGGNVSDNTAGAAYDTATIANSNAQASSGHTHTHNHTVSGSAVLGVTEGATATGVTIAFDGVDATAALGGPFNADVIELNVRPYLQVGIGVLHTIAMQPSGLGRIEAHLRLGVYVAAGSDF